MQSFPSHRKHRSCYGIQASGRKFTTSLILGALLLVTGCGGSSPQNPSNPQQGLAPAPPPSQINSYFGTTGHLWSTKIDRTNTQINGEDVTQYGVQLSGSIIGSFADIGGYLDLNLTTLPSELTGQPVGFALEIPGGAAMVRYGNPFQQLIPLAPTNGCTSIGGTVTYDYLTVPDAAWAFATDNAYGTFQVTLNGSAWNFSNVSQAIIGGGIPANPGPGLPAGFCGTGIIGQSVTASASDNNPPVATVTMGFGPTGFFLEDNGSAQATPVGVVPSNALGAGIGAIGVIQPSSALNTADVAGGQYLGFYYEPGLRGGGAVTQIASFGCSGTGCPSPPTLTSFVGGVFPGDDPSQPPAQNVVVDLGTQDPDRNGLYPGVSVTISGVSFPAAAVVGRVQGEYVIFLLAEDTISNVPLAIYLFQK